MKTTVIYHRADFDGLFCREIARKFIPDAELIGWDYGDPKLLFPEGGVYVLDLSPECFSDFHTAPRGQNRLVWIDHHKTAFEKFEVQNTHGRGYRIDGVAACRLAHFYFTAWERYKRDDGVDPIWFQDHYPFAKKEHFFDRKIQEPTAVRLAGEYDIWDKRDPNAELFQHGLRSQELTPHIWESLLNGKDVDDLNPGITHSDAMVASLLEKGRAIQYSKARENEGVINAFGFTIHFEGFCLLACNAARYNSQLFSAGLKPDHDGCLGFNWDGQAKMWRISLYTDKAGVDLSPVAVKYGGGGHKGACGFRVDKLPFLP